MDLKGHKLIGKGMFSKVYRKGNDDTVIIVSDDNVKECLSLGWMLDSPLFPKVERLEICGNGKSIYKMKFYEKIRAPKKQLNERSYEIYKALRKIELKHFKNNWDKIEYLKNQFSEKLINFPEESEVLCDAIDALTNYGDDIGFEISPRNITSDENGNIIFLDCFYFTSKLKYK